MEHIIYISLIVASLSYTAGYIVRGYVDSERLKGTRGQMELDDTPDECYACKDIGLPCDPQCRYNIKGKELNVKDVKSKKNNSEKD